MINRYKAVSCTKLISECDYILNLLKVFANKNEINILFDSNSYLDERDPNDGSEYDFVVYYGAVPAGSMYSSAMMDEIYDVDLSEDMAGIALRSPISINGGKVIYDTNGNQIAVVDGKTLFLMVYFARYDHGRYILSKILDDCQLYFDDLAEFDRVMANRPENLMRSKMSRVLNRKVPRNYEKDLATISAEMRKLRNQVFLLARERLAMSIEDDEESLRVSDQEVDRMVDCISSYSESGKFSFEGPYLVVPVGQIDIEYKGKTYDIGRMVIKIDPNDNEIKCSNLTRDVRSYPHPHVDSSGNICLGSADYGISVLLGNKQFDVAILMIVQFLKTYNNRNPFSLIENWPEK